jgi:hypothetical protein
VAWGYDEYGQSSVPLVAQIGVKAVAGGGYHSLALRDDGSVIAWGAGGFDTGNYPNLGQSLVPIAAKSDVVAVAGGLTHTVALKSDGSVVAWGKIWDGSGYVPATGPSGVTGVKAIASGDGHIVALMEDGTVMTWGYAYFGDVVVPASSPSELSGLTSIAAGGSHSLGIFGLALVLQAKVRGGDVILSWPTNVPNFKLQSTLNLRPPALWADWNGAVSTVGSQFTVTNSAVGTDRYYRLIRP